MGCVLYPLPQAHLHLLPDCGCHHADDFVSPLLELLRNRASENDQKTRTGIGPLGKGETHRTGNHDVGWWAFFCATGQNMPATFSNKDSKNLISKLLFDHRVFYPNTQLHSRFLGDLYFVRLTALEFLSSQVRTFTRHRYWKPSGGLLNSCANITKGASGL